MEFLGVLGEKLPHTYSPRINKRIMELENVDGAYKKFEIPKGKMADFINGVKTLDIRGFNVTIPYKEEVMPYLDSVSEEAKAIGAVNTVVNLNGKLYGYNTDYFGFEKMLSINKIDINDKVVAILGSGGACKALKEVFLANNAKMIYIVSRNPKNSNINEVKNKVRLINYQELASISGDILVNSTPVGMYPKVNLSPVSEEVIKNYDSIVDIVYNPTETEFLKLGKKMGKKTVGGLYMLVGQAVKAEEIFHEININEGIINLIYDEMKKDF